MCNTTGTKRQLGTLVSEVHLQCDISEKLINDITSNLHEHIPMGDDVLNQSGEVYEELVTYAEKLCTLDKSTIRSVANGSLGSLGGKGNSISLNLDKLSSDDRLYLVVRTVSDSAFLRNDMSHMDRDESARLINSVAIVNRNILTKVAMEAIAEICPQTTSTKVVETIVGARWTQDAEVEALETIDDEDDRDVYFTDGGKQYTPVLSGHNKFVQCGPNVCTESQDTIVINDDVTLELDVLLEVGVGVEYDQV